jgi:3-oxoadipate enol-lactonase
MQFVTVNNILIHYKWIYRGKDKTFVFINSLGTDFRIWEDVVKMLQDHGNILLFDKRGHGLSDVSDKTKGLEDHADDVWLLLNYLSIEQCIVVGVSVGGIIAQLLAHYHPGSIEKLVLCDTRHKIGFTALWNDRINHIRSNGITGISEDLMKRWFSSSFHMARPATVQGYRNMLERCNVNGYVQTCEAIRDADTTSIAQELSIPAICIAGSEDKSTTPEEVKQLSELIQGSRYVIIEGSGHLPCVDNPEELSRLIIDFIKA